MSSKQHYKILVVDDEPDILELLQYNLLKEGYEVRTAENGKQALDIAPDYRPDLILLDIMMPFMDGVETCRQLREQPSLAETIIIFLTARSEEYSEVAAFENGANDYINKPIKPRALLSRIGSYVRRKAGTSRDQTRIEYNGLIIDKTSYTVSLNGEVINLPKKEFELISFLATNPNKVFSRDDLLQNIWGTDVYVLARTVDVHVRKVREKIGEGFISTVKGVGYKFEIQE